MSGRNRRRRLRAIGLGASVLAGCGPHNTAPPSFLPTPQEAGASVRGGWVDVGVRTGAGVNALRGELLAISRDSLWIQSSRDSGFVVARAAIVSGKITVYRAPGSRVAAMTGLGAISSVATGWFLIFLVPAWTVTGAISYHGDIRAAERDLPADMTRAEIDLRTVARFPQGMPAGMDASFRRPPPPR
jgi:hypothetical protein